MKGLRVRWVEEGPLRGKNLRHEKKQKNRTKKLKIYKKKKHLEEFKGMKRGECFKEDGG